MENRMIAACGIDCAKCESYVATMGDDQKALVELAERWSKAFGAQLTAQSVRCHGCGAKDGVQIGHCAECDVRICVLGKGHTTCAGCASYACTRLTEFIAQIPGARENLESVRAR